MGIERRIRQGVDGWVEGVLGVQVARNPARGQDPHLAVRALRRWSPGDVILDVGANDGRSVVRLRRHFPAARILAFEPVAATFRTLAERTRRLEDVHCFQLALGSRSSRWTGVGTDPIQRPVAGWESWRRCSGVTSRWSPK